MNTNTPPIFPKRGEIYYISPDYSEVSTEMWSGRPGIIVSNNQQNKFSNNVMVVYLTTKQKGNYPTNVPINATGKPSFAICNQVHTVAKERLQSNPYFCTTKEMTDVDRALQVAFGFEQSASPAVDPMETTSDFGVGSGEYLKIVAERDVYKQLYQDLMATLVTARAPSD